jgi:hypothetical protein
MIGDCSCGQLASCCAVIYIALRINTGVLGTVISAQKVELSIGVPASGYEMRVLLSVCLILSLPLKGRLRAFYINMLKITLGPTNE